MNTLYRMTRMTCVVALLAITATAGGEGSAAGKSKAKKKLKIVFMLGQSNMVGMCVPTTARYLTQPAYIPPRDVLLTKSRYYGGSFYWQGVNFADGPEEYLARGRALLAERRASRKHWRGLIWGIKRGERKASDWLPEYGPMPQTGTKTVCPFLDQKAEEEGIHERMAEYIESPENTFPPKLAYEQLIKRDAEIRSDVKRARKIFLKGTKTEDFDTLAEALASEKPSGRAAYAELLRKYINLPIAERTYISALGQVKGEETEREGTMVTHGPLSVGYGKDDRHMGPEYAFGITFEQMTEGPVLLVKCAWGGTSLQGPWRPPSLSNTETPIEKATREAANRSGAEEAKKDGIAFKPKQPRSGTGVCWELTMAHIKKVLADLGKYHPDYDPEAGYELVGLLWFQGWNDMSNPAYGEQLVTFIKDFRKEVDQPDLPVVCGMLGHRPWKHTIFRDNVNSGMLYAASNADLKGKVDLVNTTRFFPAELDYCGAVMKACDPESKEYKKAKETKEQAISNFGFHYHGSAKFFLLAGDAMARSMVNLSNGGEPTIHEEAKEILGTR